MAPTSPTNYRCLTGYTTAAGDRVREGRLWRSGLLPSGASPSSGPAARTVVDLRTSAECIEHDGADEGRLTLPLILSLPPARVGAIPPTDDEVADHYVWLVESSGAALPTLFDVLADDSRYPVHFHCRLGRDRTGVVAMLVLSHLGVRDDDVAKDYALTEDCGDGCLATSAVALRFLENIRSRWGSSTALLRHLGCSDVALERVKRLLLEPGDASEA